MDSLRSQSFLNTIKTTYRTLLPERVFAVWLLLGFSAILLFSALIIYNKHFLIKIPSYGGEVREGIVGTPRFINPVLAVSESDEDMTMLVYAGLTKRDGFGATVPDMASSITESNDHLHYDVILKPSATFHDGTHVTTDDVMYTVGLVQNPNIKSPHFVEWEGITIEKKSDTELVFSLKKPYPLFMNILTLGILPKHLWKNLSDDQFSLSDYNIHAIGSGPYAITGVDTVSGIPTTFTLTAHKKYTLGRPYVDTIIISTYQNEKYAVQAFKNGDVDRIHGLSPETTLSLGVATSSIHTSLLPRTYTIFFNPNKVTPLADKTVRQALQMAINKDAIVHTVLHDYGRVINSPYPFDESTATGTYDVEKAKTLLASSKSIKKGETLTLTLSTANTDQMRKVAEMVQANWQAIGVQTNLAVYEVSDLNQTVIKDRDFQVLLFGSITKDPTDLYAFWHSSQRTYPGLNISNYVSNKLDSNLDTLRSSTDELARMAAYDEIQKEFTEEVPGIFLFAPSLIYVTNDSATSPLPTYSDTASSRFTLVETWYKYSQLVWPKTYYKTTLERIENMLH